MHDVKTSSVVNDTRRQTSRPSFVVFHDGRVVPVDDGHCRTVVVTCQKYYPEWALKFDKMIKERFRDVVDDMTSDEKEKMPCSIVLSNEWLEQNGFVILHNDRTLGLTIFGQPKMTKEQIEAG